MKSKLPHLIAHAARCPSTLTALLGRLLPVPPARTTAAATEHCSPLTQFFRHPPRSSTILGGLALLLLSPPASGAAPTRSQAIEFLYGGRELFPSVLLSLSENCRYLPRDDAQLGDPTGVIAVRVTAPVADARVRVTLAETALFAESTVTEILPVAGKEFFIAPMIRWHYERLARIKQPIANLVIKMTVEIGGQREDHYAKVVVHSVNDWLQRYRLRGSNDWDYSGRVLAAAFVNENNPNIDRVVTKQALGFVELLTGYAGGDRKNNIRASVDRKELASIYKALQALGFKYAATPQASFISEPKIESARVLTQYLRLVNDSLESRQATGLESATLLASAYVKLGLHVVIMLVVQPNESRTRTLLGVFEKRAFENEEPQASDLLVIDTSLLSSKSWDQALEQGQKLFKENAKVLWPLPKDAKPGDIVGRRIQESAGNLWIDIRKARAEGVLPVPELER